MSENEFLDQVLQYARLCGWRVAHFRPARTATGWRTAVQADGKGFPDLVLLRGSEIIVAELKTDSGKVTPEQQQWLESFGMAAVVNCVWRPSDWDIIMEVLR